MLVALLVVGCYNNEPVLVDPDPVSAAYQFERKDDSGDTGEFIAPNSVSLTKLTQCLFAATGSQAVWVNFCNTLPPGSPERAECFAETLESVPHRQNWCHGRFGT